MDKTDRRAIHIDSGYVEDGEDYHRELAREPRRGQGRGRRLRRLPAGDAQRAEGRLRPAARGAR